MKNISIYFVALLCAYSSLQAQKLPQSTPELVELLHSKARETVDIIKVINATSKYEIVDASFKPSEMGMAYELALEDKADKKNSYTFSFDPRHISYITDEKMPTESPIGVIKVKFINAVCKRQVTSKQSGEKVTYVSEFFFQYLKVDTANFNLIKKAFTQLSKNAKADFDSKALSKLKGIYTYKPFWIASTGSSSTYTLKSYYLNGCTIQMFYNVKTITQTGESEGDYLTIVPFEAVEDVSFDAVKSRPNCLLLLADKKGFERFKKNGSLYEPTTPDKGVPLFIDVTDKATYTTVMDNLKSLVRECGGKRLKG